MNSPNPTNKPNTLNGICQHCQTPLTVTLPPVNVANMMAISMAIVNHYKFITCRKCQGKSTLLCIAAAMNFALQPLAVEDIAEAEAQGMLDDSLIQQVTNPMLSTTLRGLKRSQ